MYYFAYGSNMLTSRLARRVPSVRPVGPAWLDGHRLYWHLRGADGSGKCNIVATGNDGDCVHGVLFELDPDRLSRLHAAEGPAYEFLETAVGTANEEVIAATYRGRENWLDDSLAVLDWYRDFVVQGARAHGLPSAWVDWLADTPVRADDDAARAADNRAILIEQPTNAL
ncbi:MAG: gamma-glutamylcyclotransferase [Salinisphaera sp.]|jgi:gamma-glutamylcyclotransferase|nr:gamma-glutamylcyclotransferase [Salinisphaera sp.]